MNYRAAFLVCAAVGGSATVFACSGDATPDPISVDEDSGGATDPDSAVPSARDAGSHDPFDAGGSVKDATVDAAHSADAGDAGSQDGATDAGDASDGGTTELNGCRISGDAGTAFVDKSGGGRTITFSTNGTPKPYSIPCMKIKVTQKVTWTGAFNMYALEPKGGTLPSPILLTAATPNGSVTFTFNAVGVYGFDSNGHAGMLGAIEVTQ